jgi:hypothetical protein
MTDQHTPGPWRIAGKGTIRQGDDIWIAKANWRNAEANTSRIVAAVNATEGISTEALEAGVVGEMLAALRAWMTYNDADDEAEDDITMMLAYADALALSRTVIAKLEASHE